MKIKEKYCPATGYHVSLNPLQISIFGFMHLSDLSFITKIKRTISKRNLFVVDYVIGEIGKGETKAKNPRS